MRVKLNPGYTLANPNYSGRSGHVIEVDDEEGEQLVDQGYAVAAGDEPEPKREKRIVGPAEAAVVIPAERTTAADKAAADKTAAKAKAKADAKAKKEAAAAQGE